ncbi:DNA alkylation repair protein [Paenibacillus sp. N1-5-1-14]|uniref:DNA alkylation repair protein n=1 Tax=Paenibacillus radicibacter TaxID=2972488 RepID=UPI002158EA28|nr:DNA alkylation repair protein [Paenibacillus radicibacter]MCR8645121.1 DNA alkylation repair protein [Paenibacillus radicibacter]
MHAYTQAIRDVLEQHRDAEQAEPMSRYMKDLFPFLGIRTPVRDELTKQFIAEHGLPALEELSLIARELWQLPEREYAYVAIFLIGKYQKKLQPQHLDLLVELITTKSWWDTVDLLASNAVGSILRKHPELLPAYPDQWIHSSNMWLARTALLYQLKYKTHTDEERLFRYIQTCASSKEFFIQKSIGWALREYSKTAPEQVIAFVQKETLAPLSRREALRWLARTSPIS